MCILLIKINAINVVYHEFITADLYLHVRGVFVNIEYRHSVTVSSIQFTHVVYFRYVNGLLFCLIRLTQSHHPRLRDGMSLRHPILNGIFCAG